MLIKGKEYMPVNERVNEFRKSEKYDGWQMLDEIVEMTDSFIAIKTTIYNKEGRPIATGIAQEFRDASNINKTSYIENCETSAWGRALGNLGIGIDANIASAEEVARAIEQQEKLPEKINKAAVDAIRMKLAEVAVEEKKILANYKVEKLEDLTIEQWQNAMRRLDKTGKKNADNGKAD